VVLVCSHPFPKIPSHPDNLSRQASATLFPAGWTMRPQVGKSLSAIINDMNNPMPLWQGKVTPSLPNIPQSSDHRHRSPRHFHTPHIPHHSLHTHINLHPNTLHSHHSNSHIPLHPTPCRPFLRQHIQPTPREPVHSPRTAEFSLTPEMRRCGHDYAHGAEQVEGAGESEGQEGVDG
jgi:hypothetical protein